MDVVLLLSHHLAIGIENANAHRHLGSSLSLSHLLLVDNFRLDFHLPVALCTDKERMAREEQILIGNDEVDITIETGTRKPAGVAWILRIRLDCDFVRLSPFQEFAQVDIEAQVSIVGTTDSLTVQIDIAHQHDALEVEHDALSLPFVLGSEFVAIPADAHLLESTGTQSAAHIAARIAIVRSLAGIRSHPVLSYQEIMWQIHHIIHALG